MESGETRGASDGAGPSSRPAYDLVGRDNPAGRLIYNLYANTEGDMYGRAAGRKFSAANRRTLEEKLASGWVPPPVEPSKPPPRKAVQVRVPRVGRHRPGDEKSSSPQRLQRKPLEAIQMETARDLQLDRTQVPVPKGPLLDDKEKERLARMMQYRGKPPEAEPVAPVAPRAPLTQREMLEDMFAQIAAEIDERKEFLSRMTQAGRTREFQGQIQGEIATRIREMERLDRLIKTCPERAASRPPRPALVRARRGPVGRDEDVDAAVVVAHGDGREDLTPQAQRHQQRPPPPLPVGHAVHALNEGVVVAPPAPQSRPVRPKGQPRHQDQVQGPLPTLLPVLPAGVGGGGLEDVERRRRDALGQRRHVQHAHVRVVVDLGKEDAEGGPRQRGVDELLRGDLAQPLRADVEGQASRLLERGRGEDRVADCGTFLLDPPR